VSLTLVTASLVLPGCAGFLGAVVTPDYTVNPQVIAVVGDFGSGKPAELRVSKMVSSQNPSFVLTVGDNNYTKSSYDKEVGKYYSQPIVAATGNHDYLVGIERFDKFFGIDASARTYVYRAESGVDFFILDSTAGLSKPSVRAKQLAWLKQELLDSDAKFKVVVLHHPPYSSSRHGSTKVYQWDYSGMGADLVLSGHDHSYERINRAGITYVVDGTGGAPLYKCKKLIYGSTGCNDHTYGALFLYVNSSQLTGIYRNTDGHILDSFNIN
jgi:tartrate-resistant acid phosphatase type 5